MDSKAPITISSSDSEIEIEEDVGGEVNSRILPAWANSTSYGNGGYSRQDGSSKRAHKSSGSSSNGNTHLKEKSPQEDAYTIGTGGQGWSVNPRIANATGPGYEKYTSQQALKRTLPASLQPPVHKVNNAVPSRSNFQFRDARDARYNLATPSSSNSFQFRDTNGNSQFPTGLTPSSSKAYTKDHFDRAHSGGRILPSSMMHGLSTPTLQYAGSKDHMYRSGFGDERATENDERLIYQAALEDLNQPKVEVTPPDGLLSVPLLRHQKIALAWMLQKETRSLHCLGGILADDQGLGKTVSMIALILMQRSLQSKSMSQEFNNTPAEALNLDDDDDNVSLGLDNGVADTGRYTKKKKLDDLGKAETLILDDDDGSDSSGLDKVDKHEPEEANSVKQVPKVSTSRPSFRRQRPAAGTLVVCPASVLRQWQRELSDKVTQKLEVLFYHGGNRTKDPMELSRYDVVLTTYAIVTNEVPKQPLVDDDEVHEKHRESGLSADFSNIMKNKKMSNTSKKGGKRGKKGLDTSSYDSDCGPLARVGWFRVILDEAQTIKNHRTQVARACSSLRAKRRWCLSGTPIQNSIDDLYSYFRFLKYDPYAVYKSFCDTIKVPISKNSLNGYKKLQAVLRAVMLRRTKGTLLDGEPIIDLPPKTASLKIVQFSPEERAFYHKLEADSRSQFKAYAAAGTLSQNYANILLLLLRLRQACDHPSLVKGRTPCLSGEVSSKMAKRLPKDLVIDLLKCLEASFALCRECDDPPEDPVVARCRHVFCYQCISEYLTGDDNTCPVAGCKEILGTDVVFSKATLRSVITDGPDSTPLDAECSEKSMDSEYTSSKIRTVLEILHSQTKPKDTASDHDATDFSHASSSSPEDITECYGGAVRRTTVHSVSPDDAPVKTIIFTQWTRMLDLVEAALNEHYIQYRRLDGTMSLLARDRAVKSFNTDPEVTVMLMSLKAGNLGLNMVAASHVILLDLWWNPTTEDQAIDRAHRIGQTRPVTVTRITIDNTVEDRILSLQEEKRKMVASAFGEDQSGSSASRLTVDDLKYLFMGRV